MSESELLNMLFGSSSESEDDPKEEVLDEVKEEVQNVLTLHAKSAKGKKATRTKRKAKRKSKRTESYGIYIFKVLRQVHPQLGISKRGMSVMNSFINDVFERIASEAGQLARYNKKSTLSTREVQAAIRLLLPRELADHAKVQGTKAVEEWRGL